MADAKRTVIYGVVIFLAIALVIIWIIRNDKVIVHYTDSGIVKTIQADTGSDPLFTIQVAEDGDFEATLLDGLKEWACANKRLYRLPADVAPDMLSIGTASIPTYFNRRISISRFEQTYRGLPVYGRSEYITVVVVDRTDVRKISGQIIDDRQPYRGFESSISTPEAVGAMTSEWKPRFAGAEVFVRDVRKVAIPDSAMIGYIGEISTKIFSSSRLVRGNALIDAETGDLLLFDETKAEARVRGLELKDHPRTETKIDYDFIPATHFGITIHLSANPALDCDLPPWRDFRMGNDTRFSILNFKKSSGSDIDQIVVGGCASGTPPPFFDKGAVSGWRFRAQDLAIKTTRVLDAMDPLMGELSTHGVTHSYSWNHHPDVPSLPHRAPLVIAVNADCDGAVGKYDSYWISEIDTNALELPVPNPLVYVCRNENGEVVGCEDSDVDSKEQLVGITMVCTSFPFHTRLFFHEMGHYYDKYNAYGFVDDGEYLREIVCQLFSLYLHRKLYPELTYTLSTIPDAGCNLGYVVSHSAGVVVHPDCVDDTSDIARSIVPMENGYRIQAFTQAYWSLLFGVRCTGNDPIFCDQPNNLPSDYEDRWMEALLFALQMGNDQSYVELWENMELFILANNSNGGGLQLPGAPPNDLALIQSVRAFHGLN